MQTHEWPNIITFLLFLILKITNLHVNIDILNLQPKKIILYYHHLCKGVFLKYP